VQLIKHTGLLMMWYQQSSTVVGTYAQCDAAIRNAQVHNMLAGWWSPLSVLLMNWIALFANWSARKALQRSAAHAYTAGRPVAHGGPWTPAGHAGTPHMP